MLKKLLSQIKSFFSQSDSVFSDEEKKEFMQAARKSGEERRKKEDEKLSEVVKEIVSETQPKQEVQVHLDTGKIVYPDNITEAEKAEIDAAIAELNASFQNLAPDDLFKSLEDFIKAGSAPVSPVTSANNIPEGQLQVLEEMENCKEDTDHWSDEDFIEALFGYYNSGYDFPGIEEMSVKLNERLELSQSEKKQLRDWYLLATQELVICE